MNVVFIGSLYPHESENEIRENSKGGIDNAANNFQWALLKGLDYYYPHLKVITQPGLRTFPIHYRKIQFRGSMFSHKPGSTDYCLGFINLPLIKHLAKEKNLYKKLNKIISKKEKTTIIIYGIHSPFLKAAVKLKKGNPSIKVCLIAPDLPQFMSGSKNLVYRILKYIDSVIINKCLKEIDAFVPLNENMLDFLQVGNRPWTRVEGIFNTDLCEKMKATYFTEVKQKIILYTGNIGERYGVKTLIEAFGMIRDENYRLWIRGNGDTENYVRNAANRDKRIVYFNEMSMDELIDLMKKATVLINPTPTDQYFSKYFFPSKIINYMASGTPTITTRIEGISEEYLQYCYVIEEDSKEGLRKKIMDICEKDQEELFEFGEKASQFIIENKNPVSQVRKIYDLLNSIS